ncbi:MAG: hypothetical protein U5K00_02625 [Melioribacteraceae bacterium]|nr:hypothetical protein [Melioribacteraceae bacterium]
MRFLGYTPLKIKPVDRSLTLSKNGYAQKNILLETQKSKYHVDLEFTGIKKSIPFTQTTTFKILVGSAIVLGGTAAYFKLEADKKFDKYLETRHSKYLDDTDQFDLYSGLAFGALQINFGALLYFFLFDN